MKLFSSFSGRALIAILLIWVYAFTTVKRWNDYHLMQWDILEYYSYLPAAFIKHDLSYSFIDSEKEGSHWKNLWVTPQEDGKKSIRMTMGLSFLYLPFFLIAHLIAGWLGYAADGFSIPYQIAIAFGSIFYAFIGIYVLRKLLLKYFSEIVTAISLFVLVLGTNLWSGTLFEPGLTHPYLLMLIAIFLWLTIKWIEKPGLKIISAAGLIAGLIILIRPTNILVLLIPLLLGVTSSDSLKTRFALLWKFRLQMLVFALCLFAVFIPQMVHWKYLTGQWINYTYGEERFYFLKPHILSGLFSYRKGWLVYTPVILFALTGIYFLRNYLKEFFWPVLVFTVLNIWIVLSWWCWWYGGCFGMRPMIESYAVLIFPLAAFIHFAWEKRNVMVRTVLLASLTFFIWLNLFQSKQYSSTLLHYECTSKALYLKIFGTQEWPENYKDLMKCPSLKKGEWEKEEEIEKIF